MRLIFLLTIFSFNTAYGLTLTEISRIQGDKKFSPYVNKKVTVEGVVIGDFQKSNELKGYFIQSINPDKNKHTSNGLFIKDSKNKVEVGDLIRVTGTVSEAFDVTQIEKVKNLKTLKKQCKLPKPFALSLPLNNFNLETIEGMRVTLKKPAVISDQYGYIKFGELTVSSKLLMNPTSVVLPGQQAMDLKKRNTDDRLIIDDGSKIVFPQPFKTDANHPIVLGSKLQTIGVMHYSYDQYKLEPTETLQISKTKKLRSKSPEDVNGKIKIANFNLKNFFTTLDKGKEECGPQGNFFCRGADNKQEYNRQLKKLVATINAANPAILGVEELENNKNQSLKALVNALNKATHKNKWAYINTGILGLDVIKVGLLYQPKNVSTVGNFARLNKQADPEFEADKNRVSIAQSFKDNAGHVFTIAVAHLKSKNCRDAKGVNKNQNDGQSCYNPTRTKVAQQMLKWLKTNPTKSNSDVQIIVGDFNAYQKEDPIQALEKGGYHNLADSYLPAENWSTSFRGTLGAIDHILVNSAAQKAAKGFTQWHINSIENAMFDYNLEKLNENLKKPANFYQPNPFSSSDHDLVMAGFDFGDD